MMNDGDRKPSIKCFEYSSIDVTTHLINQFWNEANRDGIIATRNQIKLLYSHPVLPVKSTKEKKNAHPETYTTCNKVIE